LLGKKNAWAAYGLSQLTFLLPVITPTREELELITNHLKSFFFPNKTLVTPRRLYAPVPKGGLGVKSPEVYARALKVSLLAAMVYQPSPLSRAIAHFTSTKPFQPPPWVKPRTPWRWLNEALKSVRLASPCPMPQSLIHATTTRPHLLYLHHDSTWRELRRLNTTSFYIQDEQWLRTSEPPSPVLPIPYTCSGRHVRPAPASLIEWLELYVVLNDSSSSAYLASIQQAKFLPYSPHPLPFDNSPAMPTLQWVMDSKLRNKLKEFVYLLSTNSLPIRVHRPCPLCFSPMDRSHLRTCSAIQPPAKCKTRNIVFHLWAHWRAINHYLHEHPPPVNAHSQLADPRDLVNLKVNTFWSDYNPQWWSGVIDEVNIESKEFHVEYIRPSKSTAWIPFDFYGWYVPYTYDQKTAFKAQTPHLVKNFYEAEYKRHKIKLQPPPNNNNKNNFICNIPLW
jgi:hypothetical protein